MRTLLSNLQQNWMNQILGVWVNYFINLHYEIFYHTQCVNKLTIYLSVYQINTCEHSGIFITFVVLSGKMMTFNDFFIIILSKNKDWGYDALSLLNF